MNYFPTSYSPLTHLSYGGGIEACTFITPDPSNDDNGYFWLGGTYVERTDRVKGSVTAMDPSPARRWRRRSLDAPIYSGVTATAGGLVFTATTDGVDLCAGRQDPESALEL